MSKVIMSIIIGCPLLKTKVGWVEWLAISECFVGEFIFERKAGVEGLLWFVVKRNFLFCGLGMSEEHFFGGESSWEHRRIDNSSQEIKWITISTWHNEAVVECSIIRPISV